MCQHSMWRVASLAGDDARLSRRPPAAQQRGCSTQPTCPSSMRSWPSCADTGENRHGWRLRAVIVVLWRAGLRVQEALALTAHDLDPRRGSRQAVVRRIGAPRVPRSRRQGRYQAPLRAASAAPRARARTRARGRTAEHHSAPARARQPRHDLDLPPRHRSRGDPRSGPCATAPTSGSAPALPLSPDETGVRTPGPGARAVRPERA
jgi:hypothetical protein